ncbi:MAG: T9SS type A sorting domain-containing protein [Aequorivita sp.]|nr:T9SS type A sorting domain-containing protein [Aequorivita sp.]
MKYLYFLLFLFACSICAAQDPQLFDNPWYLHKITIDDTDYLPPNNGDVVGNYHVFSENPSRFQSGYCDSMTVAVTYDNQNTELSLEDNPPFLLGFCLYNESEQFGSRYFSILFQNSGEARNPFGYIITANGTSKTLEITNPDGDIAFYSSEPLSISEFNVTHISIYPNPVKEELILNSASKSGNLTLNIFSTAGKLLSTQKLELENQSSIAISQLATGIYFLNIEDENGNTTIKKFIKE